MYSVMSNPRGCLEFGVYILNVVGGGKRGEKAPMERTNRFLWERQMCFRRTNER